MKLLLPTVATCAAGALVSGLAIAVPAAADEAHSVSPDVQETSLTDVDRDGLDAPGARESAGGTSSSTENRGMTNLPNVMKSTQAQNDVSQVSLSLNRATGATDGTTGLDYGGTTATNVGLQSTDDAPSDTASDGASDSIEPAPAESTEPAPAETTPDISGGVSQKTEDGLNIAAISGVLDVNESRSSIVGVTYQGDSSSTVQVRSQATDGSWGSWQSLEVEAGEGDSDGTEPFIVSQAKKVQMRVLGDTAPSEAKLLLIDPKYSAADSTAVAENAPVLTPDTTGTENTAFTNSAATPATDSDPYTGTVDLSTAAGAEARTVSSKVEKVSKPSVGSRKSWGANESMKNGSPDYASSVKAAVVHHTAGSNNYTADEVPGILRGIYTFHTQGRGWNDIGYNMLADKYGRLWEGRAGGLDKAVIGAHVQGYNTNSFGISVMGTYDKAAPPQKTLDAVEHAIAWKLSLDGVSAKSTTNLDGKSIKTIVGHRDLGQTTCPGDAFYAKMGSIRSAVAEMQSTGTVEKEAPKKDEPKKDTPKKDDSKKKSDKDDAKKDDSSEKKKKEEAKKSTIETYYAAHGSDLGKPEGKEFSVEGGRGQKYENGYVYSKKGVGTFRVKGKLAAAAGPKRIGTLGFPTAEENKVEGGYYQAFEKSKMYYSKASGAHYTQGELQKYWASKGWEGGHLGYPTSDPSCSDGRCEQTFEGAKLVWAEGYGTTEFSLTGAISGNATDGNAGSAADAAGPGGAGDSAGSGEDPADSDRAEESAGSGEEAADDTNADETVTPEPSSSATPSKTAEPKPSETAAPAPTKTAEPKPSKTAEPAPSKTAEPKPKPSKTAEPKPSKPAAPKPAPSKTAAPKPTEDKPTAAETEAATRKAVTADAHKYLGVPYVWGGTSPTTGWDCSAYVQYVFAKNGISLPRTTSQQRYAGEVISKSEAKPGDLVWIPGHIGIISEHEGKMYDAGSPRTDTSERSYSWMLDRGAVFIRVID